MDEQQFNKNLDELESLLEKCNRLPPDKKAQLLKSLLGDQAISVVFGNSNLYADTIYQINVSDNNQVAELFRTIAQRIEKEIDRDSQADSNS
ncbi:hypothetical protein [Chroococcidiopsis sp.]|uniref:hypothetical protein n=1 Tax=Chroococcidiopsis sp. TaxID=3088168 RepID=UPI003F668C9A